MKLLHNLTANSASQIYATCIAIAFTPIFLKLLGAEAYGLVGIFALVQIWMSLLDVGLAPMISREVALNRSGQTKTHDLLRLTRTLETLFFLTALAVIAAGLLFAGSIADNWIKFSDLDRATVISSLSLMSVIVGLRWFSAVYRAGVAGREEQVWLSFFNMLIMTAKFPGSAALLAWIDPAISSFFYYQLAISVIELATLRARFLKDYGATPSPRSWFYTSLLRPRIRFVGSLTYTAALWAAITQTDKIILSKVIGLDEFGYYALIGLMASAITLAASPVAKAVIPRMTYLYGSGELMALHRVYRLGTKLLVSFILPIAALLIMFPREIVLVWTGDAHAAEWIAPILPWMAAGHAVLALSAYPYYIQKVTGDLRLHVIGSTLMALLQVPLMYFAAVQGGPIAVGMTWFIFLLFWFFTWVPYVFSKVLPNVYISWLYRDVLPSLTVTALVAILCLLAIGDISNLPRARAAQLLSVVGLTLFAVNIGRVARSRELLSSLTAR